LKIIIVNILFLATLLCSPFSNAEILLSVTCGDSSGYSYYFEGGAVDRKSSGFTEDGITGGKITLTLDDEGKGEVLHLDATQKIKSVKSEGGQLFVMAGDSHVNWFASYPDGTITLESLHLDSMKLASYRNTAGNKLVAKNSLMTSDCKAN